MTPDLAHVTRVSRANPKLRFNSLMGLLFRGEGLHASFGGLPAKKAPGVDGIRKADYEKDLEGNLESLSRDLRSMGYRPRPARRVYIPKANGGRRALGIPCFEDRIVQDRMSRLLQAIWEPEFRDCSFGFRPGRSAHDALRRLATIITHERIGFVVEADVKGFFDNVGHTHMIRFLEHRIGDKRLIRLLHRFLKAGIMEDGAFTASDSGTPQGGLVSPVLANIYLHYALDWWFEGRFAKSCRGAAKLVRYAVMRSVKREMPEIGVFDEARSGAEKSAERRQLLWLKASVRGSVRKSADREHRDRRRANAKVGDA
jgi:RNA-directed DNA polymerase